MSVCNPVEATGIRSHSAGFHWTPLNSAGFHQNDWILTGIGGHCKVLIKGTVDIGTNTEGLISLNAEVKASLTAPTYLAPIPAVANWARSRLPTTYTVGSRKSPQLIQPPLGKSPG